MNERPSVERARLEMLRTEAAADKIGALEMGRVREGHPAFQVQQAWYDAATVYSVAIEEATPEGYHGLHWEPEPEAGS